MPPRTDDVQHLVDQLAESLRRSVSVDDRSRHYLTSSRHFGDLDDLRVNVLLSRELSHEASEYLFSFVDAAQSAGPIEVPANPSLGIARRRCYPVQKDDAFVGYLWLIGDATKAEDRLIAQTLPLIAEALIHRSPSAPQQDSDLWNSLPLKIARSQHQAMQELWSNQTIDLSTQIAVIISYAPDISIEATALAQYLDHFTARSPLDRRVLRTPAAARGDLALTLLRFPAGQVPENLQMAQTRSRKEHESLGIASGHSNWGRLGELEGLLTQAALAAYTAFEWEQSVVPWSETSYFGLLLEAVLEDPTQVIPSQVARLRTTGASADLIKTAVAFFQEAGDISKTSEHLRIHRTTLYYRLARIEELTGYDLKSGNDRLALQIGTTLMKFLETSLPAFLHSEEN